LKRATALLSLADRIVHGTHCRIKVGAIASQSL
jgi:hypothetical protein